METAGRRCYTFMVKCVNATMGNSNSSFQAQSERRTVEARRHGMNEVLPELRRRKTALAVRVVSGVLPR